MAPDHPVGPCDSDRPRQLGLRPCKAPATGPPSNTLASETIWVLRAVLPGPPDGTMTRTRRVLIAAGAVLAVLAAGGWVGWTSRQTRMRHRRTRSCRCAREGQDGEEGGPNAKRASDAHGLCTASIWCRVSLTNLTGQW
jgi:hypothetical protein